MADDIDDLDAVLANFPDQLVLSGIEYLRERWRVFHELLIKLTPYDRGEAKANWVISIGEPDTTRYEMARNERIPMSTAEGISRASQIRLLAFTDVDQTVYITNNAPHIIFLEQGHSKQAPQGIRSLAIAILETQESINLQA